MKYAIQPILADLAQWVEDTGLTEVDPEEALDNPELVARETMQQAVAIVLELYHANK